MRNITIEDVSLGLIREGLKKPFGFKGRYIDRLWQSVCRITTNTHTAVCPATQSVLWSDADVFGEHTPDDSDALMYKVTEHALSLIKGATFSSPDALIYSILPSLSEYAAFICGRRVKTTFLLNSLVGLDNALWSLYAMENDITSFDGIIPNNAKDAMSYRHKKLAHIPLVSYNVTDDELAQILDAGAGLIKIKIGNSVDKSSHDADMKAMTEWDKARVLAVHHRALRYETNLTKSGRVCYYLDANGRYDTKDRLWELIYFMDKHKILENVAIIEEPFDEENKIPVYDFPVVLNADESAHSERDLELRIALGYRSVALKPIAKTLSVSFRMAEVMRRAGGQCLCADLTVNPLLVEWNKQFASRIAPLSVMNTGCLEVNGDFNYLNWDVQTELLPEGMDYCGAADGCFTCDNGFYEKSGLLFGKNGYFTLFSH